MCNFYDPLPRGGKSILIPLIAFGTSHTRIDFTYDVCIALILLSIQTLCTMVYEIHIFLKNLSTKTSTQTELQSVTWELWEIQHTDQNVHIGPQEHSSIATASSCSHFSLLLLDEDLPGTVLTETWDVHKYQISPHRLQLSTALYSSQVDSFIGTHGVTRTHHLRV